jgi:hypothetical protein
MRRLLSCSGALQGVLPKFPPASSFPQSSEVDREILHAIVVAGGWDKLATRSLWRFMPKSKCTLPTILYFESHSEKYKTQEDCDEEECQVGSYNEYDVAADLGFGSSKPGRHDKEGNPIIIVVDRSGVHEIGVTWCRCSEASEHDMQLMMAGLFPATFHNPKTAFTFRVLEEFHLDNLECKTTPSQFFSRLRRLTNDEFPNTVPVGGFNVSLMVD